MVENDNHNGKKYYEAAAALRERQMQGKERMRKHLASLSISEKIKILEKLRDREKAIVAAGLRKKVSKNSGMQQAE